MATVVPATPEQADLRQSLLAAGLLLDTGVAGVYGLGELFVGIKQAVAALVDRAAADEQPLLWRFPMVMPRRVMETNGYLRSFPHLAGTLWGFDGGDREAARLANLVEDGADWSGSQQMTDLVMVPAACHPVYPALAARGPVTGALTIDGGTAPVFRSEPSDDPSRMQAFEVKELVRVGRPDDVQAWRDRWRDRGLALTRNLGLQVSVEEASDPFFGRVGRLMSANQIAQALKFELLVDVVGSPVAVGSFNYHREHFTEAYGITSGVAGPDGELHTACLGFGLDRLAIALLAAHGLDPAGWPGPVRATLWP